MRPPPLAEVGSRTLTESLLTALTHWLTPGHQGAVEKWGHSSAGANRLWHYLHGFVLMGQPGMKHPHESIFLPVFLFLALVGTGGCEFGSQKPPAAVQGVMDLTRWDFDRRGPVDLSGEYEFYWNQHLSPADFNASPPPRPSGFIKVPGFWNGYRLNDSELPGEGHATYRLTVRLPAAGAHLSLKVSEVSTAYRLYVNGIETAAVGVAGASMQTSVPSHHPVLVSFTPDADRVVLLIQVSNFHHRRGGLWELITLGHEEHLARLHERKRGLDFFLLGGIFIMAVYHLGLFLARRKFRSTLYFGIFCFLVALRLLTTDERYLVQILPALDWELLVKVEYLSFYLAVPVFGMFFQSLFPVISEKLLRLILFLGGGFSLLVLLTPVRVFSYSLPVYEFITLALMAYTFRLMLSQSFQRQPEAFVFLAGTSLLCLAAINDILYVERIVNTGFFAPLGLFLFVFAQAFILYLRIIKAFTLVESRGVELRDTLESYKQEVLDRMRIEEALRESEEKYRTILNSIQEGYYEVDLSGNMMFCNDSLCGIIGYSRDELIGMNNRQYMPTEAFKRVYETFLRVYNTGEATKAFDWEVVTKDGAKKIVEASVTLIRDMKGTPAGFRGVVRDITDRKRAEEQARVHQQQLMQASKMAALGVLVSGVAHEINNPNNFIMLNAPLLREAWDNALPILEEYYRENGDFLMGGMMYSEMREQMPKLLSGVAQGAERIKQIVTNLKSYVRGDSGDLSQAVDVNAVLRSSLSLISNVIKNATDHFTVNYEADLPLIRGSFQRLEQVILNLIQNACQALPDKKKGLFVTTSRDGSGAGVVVTIQDEGSGIRPEDLPRIREPLFTTRQEVGGIGLGLSISSKIIEEHRGSLRFTSAPGKGTTVTITLPADQG
jgi:PAS domain S-box-containing protein